jgi:hypothetical protein
MLCLVPTGLWATWHFFAGVPHMIRDQEKATGVPYVAAP